VPDVHILGIRHHGPGSARSVAEALDALAPTLVLIEGAPELDPIAALAGDPDMIPPVAGLVYAVDDPRRASFYPLASFSPEWVALRWALANGSSVRSIDLPETHGVAIRQRLAQRELLEEADGPEEAAGPGEAAGPSEPARTVQPTAGDARQGRDPIAALAGAAGYDDPERWWEDAVERREGSVLERFAALSSAIAELRRDEPAATPVVGQDGDLDLTALADPLGTAMTALREAAMRTAIRAASKGGDERIAVVCGAWHAPALEPASFPSVAADRLLLRGLPKTKVAAAWVPWTASRLSYASGYGAGVSSPGWYRHLFEHARSGSASDVATVWLVKVAQELRRQGIDASTASVVEADRLASALATVRGRPGPGLDELDDAALSVLADGNPLPLSLVHDRLVVGDDIGSVPAAAPLTPLAADLERAQRATRLKPAAHPQTVTLDLRTDAGRARSTLLHRLRLLGIPWGAPVDAGRTTGTFKEAWELTWSPELAVAVVEASVYGTTLASATAAKVAQDARDAPDLAALSELISQCLRAETPVHDVVARLAERAATHTDALELLAAIEPLATVCRYGNVRGVETGEVRAVLDETAVRACVGLPPAAVALDDDAATALRSAVESAHRGLTLLEDEDLLQRWWRTLGELADHDRVPGLLSGRATRMLLDAALLDADTVATRMSRALSIAADPADAAGWIDGFLTGDATVLIHDPALLALLDEWLGSAGTDVFDDILPLLRRTFSAFTPAERARIGHRISDGPSAATAAAPDVDAAAAQAGLRAVARLLGWKVVS